MQIPDRPVVVIPRSGMVISYAYVRSEGRDAGEREGEVVPCLIIGFQRDAAGDERVAVAPIFDKRRTLGHALLIPAQQRRGLGLGANLSYVMLTEFNSFKWLSGSTWPRDLADAQRRLYGFVSKPFRDKVLREFEHGLKTKRVRQILRTDPDFGACDTNAYNAALA